MSRPTSLISGLSGILAATLLLAGCSVVPLGGTPQKTSSAPKSTVTPPADAVEGFRVGEIPPVPLFTLPDLSLLNDSLSGFTVKLKIAVGTYPGIMVAPAACDTAGQVRAGAGSVYLYGDGSSSYTGADGSIQNYGDGSGSYVIGGVTVNVYGDGSGSFVNGEVSIQNYGDGSGSFVDGTKSIKIYGDGSGAFVDGTTSIQNYGDGSGSYTRGAVSIQNRGDGSGSYTDTKLSIQNYGDGTGTLNGKPISPKPLIPVPTLGKFPPLAVLAPITSCGSTITLDAGVLFDFDKATIRAEAAATLDSLAKALTDTAAPRAEVGGHTDSIGSASYNQTLSEKRADAVVAALKSRGVKTALDATGYGEERPVAPNVSATGVDNPAGRQLNRRVEIFVPTV
ncbi:OmpA family protein [Lacisediminihabitans sp. FW035]